MNWEDPVTYVNIFTAIVTVASALNTVIPSNSPVGKILNIFSLAVGKAAPDPHKQ